MVPSRSLISFLVLFFFSVARGHPFNQLRIPNGARVPCPPGGQGCFEGICGGVGHTNCAGGTTTFNVFGQAFKDAGEQWTKELCQADSDGDGLTNGEELGDPCCLWTEGLNLTEAMRNIAISHPGYPGAKTNAWDNGPANCSSPDWRPTIRPPTEFFTDDDLAGTTHIVNYTLKGAQIPPAETTYMNVRFNFLTDQTYDVVGIEALIDHREHVHHFVLNGCSDQVSAAEEGVTSITDGDMLPTCKDTLYVWVPGADNYQLPSQVGIRVGMGTKYIGFHMQIHYSNFDHEVGVVDYSGIKMYYTSALRRNSLAVLWAGSVVNVGTIPAKTVGFFSSSHCVVELKQGYTGVQYFGFTPHAHQLGKRVRAEVFRKPSNGQAWTKLEDAGYEPAYDFSAQYMRTFSPQTLRTGDVLATTCVYDSTSRNTTTRGGDGTRDEMCVAFIYAYPAEAINSAVYCNGAKVNGVNNSLASYKDVYPDFSGTDYHLPLTAAYRRGLLTCPDPELQAAMSNTDGGSSDYIIGQVLDVCTSKKFGYGDFAYMFYSQGYTNFKGVVPPCEPQCAYLYINAVLCSTVDDGYDPVNFVNMYKESWFSRECFGRLGAISADVSVAAAAIPNKNQCAWRPKGNLKKSKKIDGLLKASCGGALQQATTGAMSSKCAKALVGFASCADARTRSDKVSLPAYCYVRSAIAGDKMGLIGRMLDAKYPKLVAACGKCTGAGFPKC